MTELSFLIELLLNHEVPKGTKDLIASRIKEVEQNLQTPIGKPKYAPPNPPEEMPFTITTASSNMPMGTIVTQQQVPSTLALMAKHGDIPTIPPSYTPPPPEPVAQIAQTPATIAAMQSRSAAIAESIAGKIDKTTGKPRKW